MVNQDPVDIAIIGSGNVATHLAGALQRTGATITAVISRDRAHADALAARLGVKGSDSMTAITGDEDFVIIAVSDSAVTEVAESLPPVKGIVVHTSGSVPMDNLRARHCRCGVLYPLQTFSKNVEVDMAEVPFFTEGSDTDVESRIAALARRMSASVYHADSSQRSLLHVAGVLSSNFTIYLLGECSELLSRGGYPLEVVKPLVKATVEKAFAVGPDAAMTGPARRGDIAVIEKHLEIIPSHLRPIYSLISNEILKKYSSK